jgi:hypothetical protein
MTTTDRLFEIHISIKNTNENITKFRLWCLDNDIKPIYVVGQVPEYTFSKYTNSSIEKIYTKTFDLVRNLLLYEIILERIRIEMIFLAEDPFIDSLIKNPSGDSHGELLNSSYFEFHLKYHIINSKDYHKLHELCETFNKNYSNVFAFIGFNALKKSLEPILTLRVFKNNSSNDSEINCVFIALKLKDSFIDLLKLNGFKTNEQIHKEFVIYDREYQQETQQEYRQEMDQEIHHPDYNTQSQKSRL